MTEPQRGFLQGLWQRHEKLRFLVLGAYNTAFGYLVFAGAYLLLGKHLHYMVLLLGTHFIAVFNAFLGHKYLTFRVRGHFLADLLRFNLSYLGSLAFGLVGMPVLVELIGLHPLASQATLIILTLFGSFILHKRFSFRRA